jgi:hypothetical protein
MEQSTSGLKKPNDNGRIVTDGGQAVEETRDGDGACRIIVDSDNLRYGIEPVAAFSETALITVGADHISIEGCGEAMTAASEARLSHDGTIGFDGEFQIGLLALSRLLSVLETLSGRTVDLVYQPNAAELTIESGGVAYTLPAVDADTIRQYDADMNVEYTLACTIRGEFLADAVSFVDITGGHFEIEYLPGEAELQVSNYSGEDAVELAYDDEALDGFTKRGVAEGLYDNSYLSDLFETLSYDPECLLSLGEDIPLCIEYTFADGDGEVAILQATRIKT